ncbi:hypothetical protein [Colwellia sp. RSH04]|uniref:hypothetical protein n=1 Tax=Colwellia sp. RSH04 TaxID=2305464 RepID=UPI0015FBC92A|nr:hypothetical protein [Colwellia sp. RSH04]
MQLLRRLSFTMLLMSLMTLVACGGGGGDLSGGGDNGGGGTDPEPIVISLDISNTNVTGQAPVKVTATLTKGSDVVPNTAVVFTLDTTEPGIGAFSPSSGTALTNAEGVAEITLTAGNVRGAGSIIATASTGEAATIGFSTQGDDIGVVGDINISVSLVDTDGNPTDTITSSKPGKVIAEVNGISTPLIVTFVTTVGEIPIATAITNSDNQASVDILAGGSLGAGSVTASIESGETGQVLLIVGSSTVTMGSGEPFVEGKAGISLEQISAGGTTVVTVNIVDDQGALFTEPVDVNFSSSCASLNTPSAELNSPITTSNGIATSTYLAKGCVGDDPINVTANAGGINLSATTSVNVLPANVGSIEFVSASPENISIVGTGSLGGSESSVVKFRVLDTNSNPVNNQVVNFSLNSNLGGIQLIPDSATTNNLGIVQTVINAGTVATSVRVQAVIDNGNIPQIASQSSVLVVSTGIPDQDSFSLSASVLNPEGWNIDGTEVEVTARLADAFNNPVPNGTAVSFTTEGGSIEPSCITTNGACTVTWRSQFPRPEGHVLGDANNPLHPPEVNNTMGQKYGGRATIIATAIGEESFPDLNGNARFDASEMAAFLGTDISGNKYDLKEAFVDHNEDGFYNPDATDNALAPIDPNNANSGALEEFFDFNVDGGFTQNDSKYNGVLCSIPAHDGCSADAKSLNVRRSLTLVMSGSNARVCTSSAYDNSGSDVTFIRVDKGLTNSYLTLTLPVNSTRIAPSSDALVIARSNSLCHAEVLEVTYDFDDDNDPNTPDIQTTAEVINNNFDNTLYIKGENSRPVTIIISDLHNQPMPAGTEVKFTATAGSVVGPSTFVWPSDNHNGGAAFGVTVKGEKEPKAGNLVVEITTPGELTTIYSNIGIDIQ